MKINSEEIIKRGYCIQEEYNFIFKNKTLEKVKLVSEDLTENLWVYPLNNSNKQEFYFIFFNDPIMFSGGPRPIAGMLGKAKSRGDNLRPVANAQDCIELFEQAGHAAIDYFWKINSEQCSN